MKYAIKMTGPVQQVLRAMLDDAAVPRYGLQISKQAGLETGTLYPVMARLERVGWVESSWEDPDLSISDGRPRRRYYQLTKDGAEQARLALAEISCRREKRRSSLSSRAAGHAGGIAMNGRLQIQSQPAACQADALAGLREILRVTRPDADIELIRRAYDVAASWHQGQTRRSGDPYITHPLAVATILAETGADDEMLCAALLHDTIEDTPYTLAALSRDFGAGVAAWWREQPRWTRSRARRRTAGPGDGRREVADARVLAIKLADRLHNMRTVQFIPQAKQLRKARESLDIFVPVAAQLRMDMIEAELETLAHATMKRNRHARSASGRLLVAVAALLPAATRTRWCEEWLGELHTLPAARNRARFAIHTVLGIPRLALTVRVPARGNRRAG